jgi:hypothetical protein
VFQEWGQNLRWWRRSEHFLRGRRDVVIRKSLKDGIGMTSGKKRER